jgi:predicted protein tyrosine phosphatase/HD superfamily phosphodiesterase
MTNLAPFVFLGSLETAQNKEFLLKNNIGAVLNVSKTIPNFYERVEADEVEYLRIPVDDAFNQPMKDYFQPAIAFINAAINRQKGVLIHCLAGISRSATIAVAYFMLRNNWSLDKTYTWLKTLRPVSPNLCFMGQLLHFEARSYVSEAYFTAINGFFRGFPVSHGYEHASAVFAHAQKALLCESDPAVPPKLVLLAALLHDVDDKKYFPNSNNWQNARDILFKMGGKPEAAEKAEKVEAVIEMIKLVACSENGDTIPPGPEWRLIPRYADRLEAIGLPGIQRCYQYTMEKGLPLWTEATPRLLDVEDIWKLAEERYRTYRGESVSMLDHFYDKLLMVSKFPVKNSYLTKEATIRGQCILDFVLNFGFNPGFSQ